MLVVEPEKRLTLNQIAKHRWLSDTPPVDTGPELELQLNKTVIDHMLQLPGLNQNMILHSLKTNSFDHIYAIYNLLVDKLHRRTMSFQSKLSEGEQRAPRADCLGEQPGPERRALSEDGGSPFVSMPTIPAVYLIGDGENQQPLEKFGEMDLDNAAEEACSLATTVASPTLSSATTTTTGYSSCGGGGDRYLTVRRHTVGPGDPAHEQVLENHYTRGVSGATLV